MACHIRNVRPLCPVGGLGALSDIEIKGGRITRILPASVDGGPTPTEPKGTGAVIDGRGALCLPGLVNSHNHTPLMSVRGMVEDLGFAPAYTPGVPQGHWLSDDETLALSRLGVMELMMAGATTIVDYYRKPEALARAAHEMGPRALVGGRVMDADSAALAEGRFEHDRALGDASLRDALDLVERWQGVDRIGIILAPHAPDTCSRAMLKEFARLAQTTGRQVHTHLAQSPLEVERIRAREGLTPVELLDDLGLLNDDLVAAHCIFLTADDIARLGRNRVVVAHAPVGNASFGAAAPIRALAEAGARITLCTDTKCADMFEAMRMAIASARWRAGMEMVLDARTVFGWATLGGATALKEHGASGTLQPGAPADLIVLDPGAPNLHPVIDGFGIVVHSGSAANVRTVICEGEILVRDGCPTRVDPAEVIDEAQRVAAGLWKRARG
ncbi:MAG: amidohydrolase family protein [Pararhodobacter sp.]|nr:amidohydrolase family protein [Pararhodobacter sp.]